MKRISLLMATGLLVLFGCSEPQNTNPSSTPAPAVAPAPKPTPPPTPAEEKSPLPEKITDKNVKGMLTDYLKEHDERTVVLSTKFGEIVVRLYESTPLHRANFALLANHYYDGTLFYRVAKDFVVQGGETDDDDLRLVKRRIGRYTIPSEFKPGLFHKRGAVAMAREYEDNPEARSSSSSFYIVVGKTYVQAELDYLAKENKITFTPEQIETYKTIGGNPSLDGIHTVFGEVISGMDVVDRIAQEPVDSSERPNEDILIKVEKVD